MSTLLTNFLIETLGYITGISHTGTLFEYLSLQHTSVDMISNTRTNPPTLPPTMATNFVAAKSHSIKLLRDIKIHVDMHVYVYKRMQKQRKKSVMSNLQTNCCMKLNFQKGD